MGREATNMERGRMTPKLPIIYTSHGPLIRCADAYAAIADLEAEVARKEQLRANAVLRCERMLAEFAVLAARVEQLEGKRQVSGRWN